MKTRPSLAKKQMWEVGRIQSLLWGGGKLPFGRAGISLRSGDTHMDWPQDFPPLKKLLQITRLCSATTGSNLLMLSRCGYSTIACGSCCGITPAPKMSSVAQPQAKPAEPAPNFLLLCLFKGPFVRDSVASDGGEAGRKGWRSLNTSTHRPATSGDILSYWFISFAKIWAKLRTGVLQLPIMSTWTLKTIKWLMIHFNDFT